MNAEEYSNLAELISVKAEIYQNILRHQIDEDNESDKVGFSNFDDIFCLNSIMDFLV